MYSSRVFFSAFTGSPQARGKSGNEETEKVIGEMYSSRVFFSAFTVSPQARPATYGEIEEACISLTIAVPALSSPGRDRILNLNRRPSS